VHSAAAKAFFDRDLGTIPEFLVRERGWTILKREYPILDVLFEAEGRNPLRLAMMCDDWPAQPPSVRLRSKGGGALGRLPLSPGGQFNALIHKTTREPFVCMVGTREYHLSHADDIWENYRGTGGYDLGGIVTRVWRAWIAATP
jgi:hypothetical protein